MLTLPSLAQETENSTNSDGTMYIIPVNADGTLPSLIDGKYVGQIELIGDEESTGVSATDVHLKYGFVFEGVYDNGAKRTFFQLSSGQLIMNEENRLIISPDATHYIPVTEGTYNITLYQHIPGVRVFTISPSNITGINPVSETKKSTAQYLDCSGHKLPRTPSEPGIYIVVSDNKSSKILIR